jgi:heme oxygenase
LERAPKCPHRARGQRGAHWRTIRRILAAVDASVSDFAGEIDAAENSRCRG